LRVGAVGAERMLVRGGECELLAQGNLPFFVNRSGSNLSRPGEVLAWWAAL
jgi:hypothetical protein